MGDFIRRLPQLTLEQFHAFRDERPKEEKWELIDGVPMMMPPPSLDPPYRSVRIRQKPW